MHLESRAKGCFSSHHLLTLDGYPAGTCHGRAFSEELDIRLKGSRRYRLVRTSFWTGRLQLFDEQGRFLGGGGRSGGFNSSWDLELSCGEASLESAGMFNTTLLVRQGDAVLGRVDRAGSCGAGWIAEGYARLDATDLLLVGLVYRTMMNRRGAATAAATSS